jgi:ATP-binding cassette subfamily G (WHITE) protein 2 (SNQ2)
VQQNDVHIATLTVEETVYFSAYTRMKEGTSSEDLMLRTNLLLQMLNLMHVKNSYVGGGQIRGISGGEARRLSIAVELVSLPELIFLDEPTSGLDSAIALEVMTAVKQFSLQNRTCIAAIHQPSSEVFSLFNTVALMCKGKLIYMGATAEVVRYFSSPQLKYVYLLNNIAEFMVEISGGHLLPSHSEEPKQVNELEFHYKSSVQCKLINEEHEKLIAPSDVHNDDAKHVFATSSFTQWKMLCQRTLISNIRDVNLLAIKLVQRVLAGILFGLIYYGKGSVSRASLFSGNVATANVTNISSMFFFLVAFVCITNIESIPDLCILNSIYKRETNSFTYSVGPYWLAHCVSQIPFITFFHFVFILIGYSLMGFKFTSGYFLYFSFSLLLANICNYFIVTWFAAFFKEEEPAYALYPLSFLFMTTFSGYCINVRSISVVWNWAPNVSVMRWCFEGLMINQWNEFGIEGENVLTLFNFNNFNKMNCIWILILFNIVVMIAIYFAMLPSKNELRHVFNVHESQRTRSFYDRFFRQENNYRVHPSNINDNEYGQSMHGNEDGLEKESNGKNVKIEVEGNDAYLLTKPNLRASQFYRTIYVPLETDASLGTKLSFKNISYSVKSNKNKNKMQRILTDISGIVSPGEICVLMGASGSGKSTLLDVLAGRKTTGVVEGDSAILFNGKPRTHDTMRNTAYVMQDNVHIGTLTVLETLMYAAQLRLSEKMSKSEKITRVEGVLKVLGLSQVANSIVGDESIRGISGGQLKRLSIAVEIVHLPDLIFLDEPTTGLDSATSFELMSAVKNLSVQNRTILSTIHQPSSITFELFDKLILLAKGCLIYFGNAADATKYFATSLYQFQFKSNSNPADFIVSILKFFFYMINIFLS